MTQVRRQYPAWKRSDTLSLLAYYLVGSAFAVWDLVHGGVPLGAALVLASFMGFFAGAVVGGIWEYGILAPYYALQRWFQRKVDEAVDERLRQLKPPKLSPP